MFFILNNFNLFLIAVKINMYIYYFNFYFQAYRSILFNFKWKCFFLIFVYVLTIKFKNVFMTTLRVKKVINYYA